jgi:hypothetical protein
VLRSGPVGLDPFSASRQRTQSGRHRHPERIRQEPRRQCDRFAGADSGNRGGGTVERDPTLLRLPGLPPITRELYDAACDFAVVETLPWMDEKPGPPPDTAARFSKVIDLRDFAFDPAFRGVAMVDFFLRRLGLDPKLVPPPQKRNNWLGPRVRTRRPAFEAGYVLVCPTASMSMRSMPMAIHDAALKWLRANTNRKVLTQAMLPRETTLAGLCGLVANASLIISTDTAMVHLADAYSGVL